MRGLVRHLLGQRAVTSRSFDLADLVPKRGAANNDSCPVTSQHAAATLADEVALEVSDITKPFEALPGPDGIRSIPFIGTRFMMKPFSPFTVNTLNEMLNHFHDEYGAIYRCRMGRDWVVYVESLEDIEKCFRSDGTYPARPLSMLHKTYQERTGKPHTLLTLEGEGWRKLRTPLNQRMNRPDSATYYLPAQNQVADDFAAILGKNSLSPAELKECFFRYASESIGVVCFNRRLGFLEEDLESRMTTQRLLECFKINMHSTGAAIMGREFKYLFFKDSFYNTFQQAMDHIMNYIAEVLNEAQTEVQRRKREGTWDENELNLVFSLLAEPSLTVADVLSVIEPLMTAGSDSTASGLQMLLYNLSRNPDKQDALAQELRDHLPDPQQPLSVPILNRLKYLPSTVKESLRLCFPLPSGVARIMPQDAVLGGYRIPKGTTVGVSSQRTAINPAYFPEPRDFLPERWIRNKDGQRETSISGFAFLPFGFGIRNCIGRRFAEQELHLAVAKVIRSYRVSLPEEYMTGKLETEFRPFVTPVRPFPFVFTARD